MLVTPNCSCNGEPSPFQQMTDLELDDATEGHYEVQIGQTLHSGRYEVLRKLETDQNASTWLARDNSEASGLCSVLASMAG
jgi:hypothetical protein